MRSVTLTSIVDYSSPATYLLLQFAIGGGFGLSRCFVHVHNSAQSELTQKLVAGFSFVLRSLWQAKPPINCHRDRMIPV